jgi:hypothetical protein
MERNDKGHASERRSDRLEGIFVRAERAAREAGLPGWHNGPADAFRHVVASAEATRRYGVPIATALGEAHEYSGRRDGQPQDEEEMDRQNNAIGIGIGADAGSFNEIIVRTKAAFVDASSNAAQTARDAPVWLKKERWGGDLQAPIRSERDQIFAWTADPEVRAALALRRPAEEWDTDDVRAVQGSSAYLRGEGPARERAFAKVRQWYEKRETNPSPPAGPVIVHAYARADGTQVAGHSRGTPHRGGAPR